MLRTLSLALLALLVLTPLATAQWVTFGNETATRLQVPTNLGALDTQEKDYAWADLDQDGDIDLVCVRKQPFTSAGRFPNVLMMNENGLLVDRTQQYASASTVSGSQGFLDATNDRDVAICDVNGDGWLDVVTAVTLSGTQPKSISHPRVYINLGESSPGVWNGLVFDDENRFPTLPDEPRFCAVSFGDVDGDGDLDLYMGDYQQGGARAIDLNDRLFINDGTGYFTDESASRMSLTMLESSFAMATAIEDLNGDGRLDILKDDALNAPQGVSVSYNNAQGGGVEGFFDSYEIIYNNAPYHIAVGDLNNDGLPDLVVTDDGADRYQLHAGNGADNLANFAASRTFSYTGGGSDDGFGGNSVIADLNNDGWNDVLITDVDVDIAGCNRRTHIFRNLGDAPNVTLQEQQLSGAICGIPTSMLTGTHDIAVFDINGDGWLDMVVGRCTGTQVWMNVPPVGMSFSYPLGLPAFIDPAQGPTVQVAVAGIGGIAPSPGTGTMSYSIDGGPLTTVPMAQVGADLYEVSLPSGLSCGARVDYYFSVGAQGGATYTDPGSAPLAFHEAIVATGTQITFEDNMEGDVSAWTVSSSSLTTGAWEQAIPNGTILSGQQAAPSEDAEAGTQNIRCFVTQNGVAGGSAGAADVDGGPTDLISPVIDLAGSDATITYSRWFYSSGAGDTLDVAVSGDGVSWVTVESVASLPGTTNQWTVKSFRVGEYITPTATTQVRFRTADQPNNSIVEAAIDLFRVESLVCSVCQPSIGFQGPGTLQIDVCGGDLSTGTTATVSVTGGVPNGTVYFAIDVATNPFTFGLVTLFNFNPLAVLPVPMDSNGEFSLPLTGGGGPLSIYAQGIYFDPNLLGGLGASNAVRIDWLP